MRHASVRRGFTLIELLVVVAIIALLIAILLPGLSRAKRSAQSAACLANVRSLAMAGAAYETTNDGIIVPGAVVYGGRTDLGFFALVKDGDLPVPALQGGPGFVSNNTATFPGLNYKSIFVCPVTLPNDVTASPSQTQDGFWQQNSLNFDNKLTVNATITAANALIIQASYGINGSTYNPYNPCQVVTDMPGYGPPRKNVAIRSPSNTVFMYDGFTINPQGGGAAPANVIVRRIAGRHGQPDNANPAGTGQTNCGFFDGHAETINRISLPNDPNEFLNSTPTLMSTNHPAPYWRIDQGG